MHSVPRQRDPFGAMHLFPARSVPDCSFPRDMIVAFLTTSQLLTYRARANNEAPSGPDLVRDAGRPSSISLNEQDQVLNLLRYRCGESLWSTSRERKAHISLMLESVKLDSLSQTWCRACLANLLREDRFQVM
jgi:hypothetical protein